jgi:hypothetical protein
MEKKSVLDKLHPGTSSSAAGWGSNGKEPTVHIKHVCLGTEAHIKQAHKLTGW